MKGENMKGEMNEAMPPVRAPPTHHVPVLLVTCDQIAAEPHRSPTVLLRPRDDAPVRVHVFRRRQARIAIDVGIDCADRRR